MKYSIFGYEQKELIHYGIDVVDLILLDYINDLLTKSAIKSYYIDDKYYKWITDTMIYSDLPFLNLKERGIENRLLNLNKLGFIERITKADNNLVKRTYTRVTEKYYSLKYDNSNYDFEKEALLEKQKEMNKKENQKKKEIPFNEIIDYLNKKADTHYRHSNQLARKHISARWNEDYSIDDFKKVIDNKCNEWLGTDYEKYLRPDTLFGTKFAIYLNQKDKINKYKPQGINDKFKEGEI